MAKHKQTKKAVAMAMAAAIAMSAMPITAFADTVTNPDGSTTTTTVTQDGEGTPEDPEVTVTITINQNTEGDTKEVTEEVTEYTEKTEEGSKTVVETETVTDEDKADGSTVDSTVTSTETTEKDTQNRVTSKSYVEDGEETTAWTEEDDGNSEDQMVVVPLEKGQKTEGTVEETTVTGDTEGTEFDYTETTTTDRTVTAQTSDVTVTVNDSDTGLVGEQESIPLKGLEPVYDYVQEKDADGNPVFDADGNPVYVQQVDAKGNPKFDKNGNPLYVVEDKGGMFDYQFNSGATSDFSDYKNWTDIPPEGEYRFVGTGEHSRYYAATVHVVYEKDADNKTVYDEQGNPIIKDILTYDPAVYGSSAQNVTINGEDATVLPEDVTLKPLYDNYGGSRPFLFMLMDKEGNKTYGYCCDLVTDAKDGFFYKVTNLEDSEYYASKESEDHIRSIVMNGYWGTSDIANKDGSYNRGSLEKIKADMKAAIENKTMENETVEIPVLDADGNPVLNEDGTPVTETKSVLDLIDGITEGEALLATQAAIWSFSNGHYNIKNGKDSSMIIDPDAYKYNHKADNHVGAENVLNDYASARIDFLYKWLINLDTEESSTVVVNENNFVENMNLLVGGKAEDHANNQDDNDDNDVYNTALNFTLAFVPGENDDLLVQVAYTDMDGNEQIVVRRLAGENSEGQSYTDIKPEDDGSYIISGLKLSENEDFNFDLRLEGTQYLEQGVYVYTPIGGRNNSQSFVGIAEGEKNVDVTMGVTVSFDVDEDNHIVAKRKWHSESFDEYEYDDDDNEIKKEEEKKEEEKKEETELLDGDVPLADVPAGDDGEDLSEIFEEDVPLADVPLTSDATVPFMGFSLLSAIGLFLTGRRKKDEE